MPRHTFTRTRTASHGPRATTVRFDADVHEQLTLLKNLTQEPINKLVNDAMKAYIVQRSTKVEAELEGVLAQIRAIRKKDPSFETAIQSVAEAEVANNQVDPAEGQTFVASEVVERAPNLATQ